MNFNISQGCFLLVNITVTGQSLYEISTSKVKPQSLFSSNCNFSIDREKEREREGRGQKGRIENQSTQQHNNFRPFKKPCNCVKFPFHFEILKTARNSLTVISYIYIRDTRDFTHKTKTKRQKIVIHKRKKHLNLTRTKTTHLK